MIRDDGPLEEVMLGGNELLSVMLFSIGILVGPCIVPLFVMTLSVEDTAVAIVRWLEKLDFSLMFSTMETLLRVDAE